MKPDFKIYIVDDEETIREGISLTLERQYTLRGFSDAESAIDALETDTPDLVLMDIGLPGLSGIEALEAVKKHNREIIVIMITAYEDISSVISCMKLGAYDYIVKPIYMEELHVVIENALETIRLRKEIRAIQEKQLKEHLPCFISESRAIQEIMTFIERVGKSADTPVLIQGETGTGKELIASTIHFRSPNHKGPYISVNCAAIPGELIESELFGYEKGAFSGASSAGKQGLIEAAAGGTLFLDEVGDMSLKVQAKLLRFLEYGEFYRVGSTRVSRVKTRIVSATNRDLETMISKDTFRKDLFFRLGVIRIKLPSLNDRPEDIELLAHHFIETYAKKFDAPGAVLSSEALDLLMKYSWSGNVRELKNMMELGVLTAQGKEITPRDLGLEDIRRGEVMTGPYDNFAPIPPAGIDINEVRSALDRHYFSQAMKMAGGNESKAAKYLNLNHHTFRYQYKKVLQKGQGADEE